MSIIIQTEPTGCRNRVCVIQGKSMKHKLMTSTI
ncbi:type-1 fimbrial protein subunit A, partial [Escherichia coli]